MENPQKSLESARQRFFSLVSSLTAFNNVLHHPSDSLPPWSTLQSQFNVLSAALASISNTLATHFPPASTTTPSALVSYPLPSFPASTQSILLSMLCNKKPHPLIADWFLRGLNDPAVASLSDSDKAAQDGFWRAVQEVVGELQEARVWYDEVVTAEEREEGVEVGLALDAGGGGRRQEEKVKGGLALESMLRFMETGVMPKDQPPLPSGVVPQGGMMMRK